MIQWLVFNARLAIPATSSAANQDCVICNSEGFGYGVFTRHRSDGGWTGRTVPERHSGSGRLVGSSLQQVTPLSADRVRKSL